MAARDDPLIEIVETFPPRAVLVGRLALQTPWELGLPEGFAAVCDLADGPCWVVASDEDEPVSLVAGDVLFLSPAHAHRLWHGASRRTEATGNVQCEFPLGRQPFLAQGGRRAMPIVSARDAEDEFPMPGETTSDDPLLQTRGPQSGRPTTTLVCGVFEIDAACWHAFDSLLGSVVHVQSREAEGAVSAHALTRMIERELASGLVGRRIIVRRLFEVFMLRTMRVGLTEEDERATSWQRKVLHPEIARALALIRRHPEKPWTVAELADRVTMSRSAFSAMFVEVAGKPPLQYLREHRMREACRLLRDRRLAMKEIAARVGYHSVSAFSTAFKRFVGVSPGASRGESPR